MKKPIVVTSNTKNVKQTTEAESSIVSCIANQEKTETWNFSHDFKETFT